MRLVCAATAGALAALAVGGRAIAAQDRATSEPRRIGRVIGVFDERTGQPIDSVEVRDMVTGMSALTTNTGTMALSFVDTAGSLIRIRKVGYSPLVQFIANSPDSTTPLTITLDPIAQRLPAATIRAEAKKWISPSLRAFEERRSTGLGYFVPDSILRRSENRSLGSVIRAYVPSVNVFEPNALTTIVTSRRQGGCAVDVYVDGMLTSSTQGGAIPGQTKRTRVGDNNLSQYHVSDLGAIEFHNVSDAPIEYMRPGGGCGVLLLWTRER